MKDLRSIPSIDRLLQNPACQQLILQYGHTLVVEALRESLERIRDMMRNSNNHQKRMILKMAAVILEKWMAPSLVKVINATGVILHTNLGRAPLSNETIAAIEIAARGYSNLEYNLNNGSQGLKACSLRRVVGKIKRGRSCHGRQQQCFRLTADPFCFTKS